MGKLINQVTVVYIIIFTCCYIISKWEQLLDFLGKVKDKAGDMEKRLKDKDKHGIQL